MQQIIDQLIRKSHIEREVFEVNKEGIHKKNLRVLRLTLLGNIILYAINLSLTFVSDSVASVGYMSMRWAYFILIVMASIIYMVLTLHTNINTIGAIYLVYTVGISYCILTSALIVPDYVSVTILAILF